MHTVGNGFKVLAKTPSSKLRNCMQPMLKRRKPPFAEGLDSIGFYFTITARTRANTRKRTQNTANRGKQMQVMMTTKEVAQLLRMSPRRVQELAAAGIIRARRPEGRLGWLFLKSDVAKYLGFKPEEI